MCAKKRYATNLYRRFQIQYSTWQGLTRGVGCNTSVRKVADLVEMDSPMAMRIAIATAAAAAALYVLTKRSRKNSPQAEFPLFEPVEEDICRLAGDPPASMQWAPKVEEKALAQKVAVPESADSTLMVEPLAESVLVVEHVAESAPAPAPIVASPSPAAAAAPIVERLAPLLEELTPTLAGSQERKELVIELAEVLEKASKLSGKAQRIVARAFADNDGPEICYEMESCMNGNWVADAKNGTMSKLSNISRLPGPIGQAFFAYRGEREKLKAEAASEVGCNRNHQPNPALASGSELAAAPQQPIITAPDSMRPPASTPR